MTEELKPCPFCGGKPIAYDMLESLSICTVECSSCDITVEGRTTEATATKWNTRALTQRPAAQEGEVDIKSRVSELIAEHGTLRAAARSLNIDVGYLSRLEHGDKVHPSSETLAKIGLRDAGVKYQRLVFLPTQPAAQAGEVDDGDVTGQPGPLPETGWDEVPEDAFRKPSPTAGMNLGERIKHVGGRENAAGYIEFGSVAAVRALVRQYLRDLPAPQQATPASAPQSLLMRLAGIAAECSDPDTTAALRAHIGTTQHATPDQFADASNMVAPVALRSVHLTRDMAGMCFVRINGRVAIRDNGDLIDHMATLEWFADTQQATPAPEFDDCSSSPTGKHSESWFGNGDCDHCKTGAQNSPMIATPEPVGEPWGWAVNSTLFRGEFAEADAKAEAKRCGGTTRAVALYDRPAPGVPEADPLQGAVDWFWQAIPNLKAHDVANRLSIGYNRAARLLAAAQAKGGQA